MSLKVWLPLNGDLENKGSCGEVITSIGTNNEWTSNGKIGNSCLHLLKASGTIAIPSMIGAKQMSFAYWVKVNNAWSENWRDGIRWYSTDGSSDAYSRQEFYTNCTKVGVWFSGSPNSISGKNFTVGDWHHLAFTIDYNIGQSNFYIDGNLVGYTTGVNTTHYIKTGNFTIGDSDGAGVDISMNDVRIYDHVLSAAEVKEISQGLVVHYKLDRPNINIVNGVLLGKPIKTSRGNDYQDGQWCNLSGGNGTVSVIQDSTAYIGNCVYRIANNTSGNKDLAQYSANAPFTLISGQKYTMSAYYRGKCSTLMRVWNATGGAQLIALSKSIDTGTEWTRVTGTFTATDAMTGTNNIGFLFGLSGNGNGIVDLCGMKVEIGEVATEWYYSDLEIDASKIEDSSGYNNHGAINGTLNITNNAPRYNYSAYMPKATTITHNRPIFGGIDQEWTCAMWVKLDTTDQAYQELNDFNYGNRITHLANGMPLLYLNLGVNDYYNYGNLAVSANEWTHIAFVFKNSNATKLIYINGVNRTNTGGPNKTSTPVGISDTVTIGKNLAGYISDYRFYCTSLLDTDIKQLYNTNMKIDNLSNIHAFNIKEQERNLLAGAYITSSIGNRTNPFTNYNSKGEMTFTDASSAGSDYIPILPTNHTYEYDITYSFDSGNHFYIGFERYDIDKTARSNNACVYVVDSTSGADHNRIKGTVNLSTDTVNQCRYIALRILNGWYNTTGTATIHNMSLHEVSTPRNHSQLTEQGNFIIDEIKENQKASFYKNGIVEAHNFIEK